MRQNHFVTSDGVRVDFIPGYFETKKEWPLGLKTFNEFAQAVFVDHNATYQNTINSPYFFINKIATVTYFREVMREIFGLYPKWRTALDIGTGPAIHPRLLKAYGMTGEAYALDINDRRHEMTDADAKRLFEELRRDVNAGTSPNLPVLRETVSGVYETLGSRYPIDWDLSASADFALDGYDVSDFISWPDAGRKFDLITGFGCIEYFDVNALFAKLAHTLNKGGVFFAFVDFWYHQAGAAMQLPMDAPWLHAALTKSDLLRYYRETRPESAAAAEKAVYFGSTHLTPIDYKLCAERHGLQFLHYRRGANERVFMGSAGLNEYLSQKIMPLAKRINPHVTLADLATNYLTLAVFKP